MTGLKAVWGKHGILLWDIYKGGVWLGSRRTHWQAIKELMHYEHTPQEKAKASEAPST